MKARVVASLVTGTLVMAMSLTGADASSQTRKYVGSIDAGAAVAQVLQNCAGDNLVEYTVGGVCVDLPAGTTSFRPVITDASGLKVPGYWVTRDGNNVTQGGPTAFCKQTTNPVAIGSSIRRVIIYTGSTSFALTPCANASPGTAGPATTGSITLTLTP